MIKSWTDLEKFIHKLLKNDLSVMPPLSGGTKGEEDVIGRSIIAQCKFSENKNMSILKKDLDRLNNACELQDKLPMFINANLKDTIISFPYTEDTKKSIKSLISLSMVSSSIIRMNDYINNLQSYEDVKELDKEITRVTNIFNQLKTNIANELSSLDNKLNNKRKSFEMYDLFE